MSKRKIGSNSSSFPFVLHDLLNNAEVGGYESVAQWQPHGRAFIVQDVDAFVSSIMPMYFNQSKFKSFQRQLSLYGFRRLTCGLDQGAYFHPEFVRNQRTMCSLITRKRAAEVRQLCYGQDEPNFYCSPWAAKVKTNNIHLYQKLTSPQEMQDNVASQEQGNLESNSFAETVHSSDIKQYVQQSSSTTGLSLANLDTNGVTAAFPGSYQSSPGLNKDVNIDQLLTDAQNLLSEVTSTIFSAGSASRICDRQESNIVSEPSLWPSEIPPQWDAILRPDPIGKIDNGFTPARINLDIFEE